MDDPTSPEPDELSWWGQHMGRLTEDRMSPLRALACEPSPQYELSAAPPHQTPWDRFVELLAHDEEVARVFHAGACDPQWALEAVRRALAPVDAQAAAERPMMMIRTSEWPPVAGDRTDDLGEVGQAFRSWLDHATSTAPVEPLVQDELTPFQAMILEVYRVHTRPGFPGSEPGSTKHSTTTCRKCAILHEDRAAFEAVLPWASARHLIPTGHSGRVRADALMPHGRVFTNDVEPPQGERIRMMTHGHEVLAWNGKRWHWEGASDGSLQNQEAWPPDDPGPYFELSVPFFEESRPGILGWIRRAAKDGTLIRYANGAISAHGEWLTSPELRAAERLIAQGEITPLERQPSAPTTFRDDHERDMRNPDYRAAYLAEQQRIHQGVVE